MHFIILFILFTQYTNKILSQHNDSEVNFAHSRTKTDLNHQSQLNSSAVSNSNNGNNTSTSPAPPVIERIEIRLVETENKTAPDDKPLIIVDVVKKNGSTGVAATIQQSILSENPTLNAQVGTAKPDQSFLLRLHQPSYHAVSYIPFETTTPIATTAATTTSSPMAQQMPNSVTEEEGGGDGEEKGVEDDSRQIATTTEMPLSNGQTKIDGTIAPFGKQYANLMEHEEEQQQSDYMDSNEQQQRQFDDNYFGDKMPLTGQRQHSPHEGAQMVATTDGTNGANYADKATTVEDDDDGGDEEVHGREEFLVNEAAILGETHRHNFSTFNWQISHHNLSASFAHLHNNSSASSKLAMESNSGSRKGADRDAAADQQRQDENWQQQNEDSDRNDQQHRMGSIDGDQQHSGSAENDQPHQMGSADGDQLHEFGSTADDDDQHQQQQQQQSQQQEKDGDEECLANRANLSRETVHKLRTERRRIVRSIQRINRQQHELCRPNRRQNHVPYRKCPMWRREKFFLYYAFMRITYCSDHERWPSAAKMRRM